MIKQKILVAAGGDFLGVAPRDPSSDKSLLRIYSDSRDPRELTFNVYVFESQKTADFIFRENLGKPGNDALQESVIGLRSQFEFKYVEAPEFALKAYVPIGRLVGDSLRIEKQGLLTCKTE